MATDLVVYVDDRRLIPASRIDWEVLDGMRQKVDMACKLWFPRSLPHQRWYRALVSAVAEATGVPHDALHLALKMKAGLYNLNIDTDRVVAIPRSTSFDAMDQTEFGQFTEFALMTILTDYLPHAKKAELIRKVDELTNLEYKEIKHAARRSPQSIIAAG